MSGTKRTGAPAGGPTFTPARIPVVDTLKSKYASTSGDGGLKMLATFFLGMSSGDQETQVVGMPLQCLQAKGSRELRAEVRLHVHMGKATWRRPSLTTLSVWRLTVGVVDTDGRRQPVRALPGPRRSRDSAGSRSL